jgi:membrane-associated protein
MLDPTHIVESGGLLLIALIIFAESGMLIGFFFPGDTLLIAAGIFAAQGKLSLVGICLVASLAAIAGDNMGYHIGRTMGPRLLRKKDGVLFRREYIEKAEGFFNRFGSKTMLLAHFVPIVRTFAPLIAGVGHMPRRRFIVFDAIGDIAWAISTTLLGYYVGSKIPNIDHYILLAVGGAMLITFGPMVWHLFVNRRFWQKVGEKFSGRKSES